MRFERDAATATESPLALAPLAVDAISESSSFDALFSPVASSGAGSNDPTRLK